MISCFLQNKEIVNGNNTKETYRELKLADQIDYLEGKPSVDVGKIYTADDNDEML